MQAGKRQRLVRLLFTVAIAVGIVGAWWWRWTAPYRTLTTFIEALYAGNTKVLYELTPEHERRGASVTPELVERTYHEFLKPLLEQCFRRDRLVRIERGEPEEVFIRYGGQKRVFRVYRREAIFYLWFQGEKRPLEIRLCLPPDRQGWRIPFSYFIRLNFGPQVMKQLGYKKYASTDGGVFWLP